jgi:hypothetical protein
LDIVMSKRLALISLIGLQVFLVSANPPPPQPGGNVETGSSSNSVTQSGSYRAVTGSGSLNLDTSGTVILQGSPDTGSNSFSGSMSINSGVVDVQSLFPSASSATIGSGAVMQISNGGSFGNSTSLSLSSGGYLTVDATNGNVSAGSLSVSGNLLIGSGNGSYQVILGGLNINSGAQVSFQFDQSKTSSNNPLLKTTFSGVSASTSGTYYIKPTGNVGVFSGSQSYTILESNTSTDLTNISNALKAPVLFNVTPTINSNKITVAVTKNTAASVLEANESSNVSSSLTSFASQLQQSGTTANQVLDNALTSSQLLTHVQNFKPSGYKRDQSSYHNQQQQGQHHLMQAGKVNQRVQHLLKKQGVDKNKRDLAQQSLAQQVVASQKTQTHLAGFHQEDKLSWIDSFQGIHLDGLSVAAEANYAYTTTPDQVDEPGVKTSAWGGTISASQNISDTLLFGVLGNYVKSNQHLKPNNYNKTSLLSDTIHSVSFFTSYQGNDNPLLASVILNLGNHHFKGERTWLQSVYNSLYGENENIPALAYSDYKGYEASGVLELGWTFTVNESISIQPYVGANFVHLNETSYTEKSYDPTTGDATAYGMAVPSNKVREQGRALGCEFIQAFTMNDDVTVQLNARLGYSTNKANGTVTNSAFAYVYDPTTMMLLSTNNQRYHYFNLNLGSTVAVGSHFIFTQNYIGKFSKLGTTQVLTLSAQYTF